MSARPLGAALRAAMPCVASKAFLTRRLAECVAQKRRAGQERAPTVPPDCLAIATADTREIATAEHATATPI